MKKALSVFILILIVGCSSVPIQVDIPISGEYDTLGVGTGTASGLLLFDIIPIAYNSTLQRAYQQAIDSKGGDALINPEIRSRWAWTPIGVRYRSYVKGEVIKYRN